MATTERMRHLLVLLGALALGGCDGGIFGTGDGSPDVIVPGADASPVGGGSPSTPGGGAIAAPGESDGGTDGGSANSVEDTGEDASASGEFDGGTTLQPGAGTPTSALRNLVTEPGVEGGPQVRLVNLGTRSLALATGLGDVSASGASSGPVASGGASAYVTLPAGAGTLWVTRDEGVPGAVADDVALHRFTPLALAPSSVTTVFVREASTVPEGSTDDEDTGFVALPTRLASDDPGQAMVRVVDGMTTLSTDGRFRLVPDGAVNPGGAEVALETVTFERPARPIDTVAPAYVPVPVGDYRLVDTDGAVADAPLSFAGGDVRTLVVITADGPPIVVDDDGR